MTPKPTSVWYNDWRQVAVEPPDTFMPVMPVSVIIPYYQVPAETLDRTLAALEGQSYPRGLFEVVIVDDGSEPPLERPRSTRLDLKVVRQERRGFGLSRARNNGVGAAAHDILLFLDGDTMVEASWIADHARWHHAVSDAITVGARVFVSADDIGAASVRRRPGSLEELLSEQPADAPWVEGYVFSADARDGDLFRGIIGGNFGIGRDFYRSVGGFDESFTQYGMEDTEFAYRAYTLGGLFVPSVDSFAWHQGRWGEDKADKEENQGRRRAKAAHLIAHDAFRGSSPGRIFKVPQYVVTIDAGHCPPDEVVRSVVDILADRVHDLVVRIEIPVDDDGRLLQYFQEVFGPDPRVRFATASSALDEFPASQFHVRVPAGVVFRRGLVHRLRAGLGDAVRATATLPDGRGVSLTRAWALHRARRTGGSAADFGNTKVIRAARLKLKLARSAGGEDSGEPVGYPTRWDTLLDRVRDTRSLGEAWALLKWLAGLVRKRVVKMRRVASWHLRRRTKTFLSR